MGKPSVCYSYLSRLYLAVFGLLFFFSVTSLSSHAGQYERYVVGTVIKVRDGDTVSVRVANTDEILEVRLYEINAPEKNKLYYSEATQYLTNQDQVLGKHVDLYITCKRKYGRYIAKAYHNSKYINLMLVSTVLATYYKFLKDASSTCSPVSKHEV